MVWYISVTSKDLIKNRYSSSLEESSCSINTLKLCGEKHFPKNFVHLRKQGFPIKIDENININKTCLSKMRIWEYLELTHKQIKYLLECNLNSRPRYLSLNLWYMIFIKNEDKDNLKKNLLHNIIFYRCINYKGKKILLK